MGGKSKPQTTTQKTIQENRPLPEQVPLLNDIWSTGANLRQNGSPAYFPDSTVVDWSNQTRDGYAQMEAMARDPNASALLRNASTALSSVIGAGAPDAASGTWNSIQSAGNVASNPFLALFQNLSGGAGNFTNTGAYDAAGNWTNPGAAATQSAMDAIGASPTLARVLEGGGYTNAAIGGQQALSDRLGSDENEALAYLRKTADGGYLDAGNPYLTAYIQNALDPLEDQYKTATAKNYSDFAKSGRFGSVAHANAINTTDKNYSEALRKTSTDIAFQNYNLERERQIAAQNAIGNFYNTDVSNQRGALGDLASTSGNQQSLRQAALTAGAGIEQANTGLRLSGAAQLGQQALAGEQFKLSANEAMRDQFNRDNALQLSAGQAGAATAQNDLQNLLSQWGLKLNAANAQAGDQSTRNGQTISAAQLAPTLYEAQYLPIQKLLGVGAASEQQTGAYLQDAINRWNYNENLGWENLERELNLHRGLGYGSSSGTSTQTTPVHSNRTAQVLGAGGQVAGMLAKCDRRLKRDVHRIGSTFTGLPLYTFRYHDDERWYFGPMADEVAAVVPGGVGILEDGEHLGVNAPALILYENSTLSKAVH